ncbi:hypothetical protein ABVF61_15855 [Roseibium sp. HPY-6]|uniref:hypothetical protein n=1 Tax=Roseibium sp. HPY-6 TaxID=3229852 RepID=UPI00338E2494
MRTRGTSGSAMMKARPSAPLPVAGLVVGKSAEDAAELLPRLFNLCRVTQDMAARMAFGLQPGRNPMEELRREILRDHLIKFCISFPAFFGRNPRPLPQDLMSGSRQVRASLFGVHGCPPTTPSEFDAFLNAGDAAGETLDQIGVCFAPGEAATAILSTVSRQNVFGAEALENSVAARQAHHPVMRHVERKYGRGPLWRATARLYDAEDCLTGRLQEAVLVRPGRAIVPAARGTYAISADVEDGMVTNFRRITPTDHLMTPGGVLDQSLASLPHKNAELAPLVLDILDPCIPVSLVEVRDA